MNVLKSIRNLERFFTSTRGIFDTFYEHQSIKQPNTVYYTDIIRLSDVHFLNVLNDVLRFLFYFEFKISIHYRLASG